MLLQSIIVWTEHFFYIYIHKIHISSVNPFLLWIVIKHANQIYSPMLVRNISFFHFTQFENFISVSTTKIFYMPKLQQNNFQKQFKYITFHQVKTNFDDTVQNQSSWITKPWMKSLNPLFQTDSWYCKPMHLRCIYWTFHKVNRFR